MRHDFLLASRTEQHSKLAISMRRQGQASPAAEVCRSNDRMEKMATGDDGSTALDIVGGVAIR